MNEKTSVYDGQRALITGGTKGIGKAAALRLADKGAQVTLVYGGDQKAAAQTLDEMAALGYHAEAIQTDLCDADAVTQLIEQAHANGPLDMLVLNAAYQEKFTFEDTSRELLEKTVGMNVFSNFQIAHAVSMRMVADGVAGRIVICGSPHADLPFEDAFAYDISKAGLHHMMRCMALPLIRKGVRVNGVEIGWTITPGERRFTTVAEQVELSSKAIPIGRSAEADEIAAAIDYLCSDESRYMAGTMMRVDGGFVLQPCPDA